LKGIKTIAAENEVTIVNFGHAGDGNVHVNILKEDKSDERWNAVVPLVTTQLYHLTLSLGGMITGEHGIGFTRRQYLPMALDAAQIEMMRGIKEVFDPNHILNPGKIFLDKKYKVYKVAMPEKNVRIFDSRKYPSCFPAFITVIFLVSS
jgi:glycolate oxidase